MGRGNISGSDFLFFFFPEACFSHFRQLAREKPRRSREPATPPCDGSSNRRRAELTLPLAFPLKWTAGDRCFEA